MSWIHCSKEICFRSMEFQFKFCIFICPCICTIDVLWLIFIMPCSLKSKSFSIFHIFICYINHFHTLWNRIGFFHTFCSFIHSNFTNHWNLSICCPYCDFNLTRCCLACSTKAFRTNSFSFFQQSPCTTVSIAILYLVIIDSLTVLNCLLN